MKPRIFGLVAIAAFVVPCFLGGASAQAQFSQQAKLAATDAIGFPQQGYSVSVADDGNTAIVGGPLDNSQAGAAWIFTRSGGVWTQQAKLVGTNVIGPYPAQQGTSVSLSGDGNTAIVGGILDDNEAGAAWVFIRNGGVWTQQAKLVGSGAHGYEEIGGYGYGTIEGISMSLSRDGNTAVVGGVSAAWVFTRAGGSWSEQQRLTGSNPTAFYASVSRDSNTLIIGEPSIGDAYVYVRSRGMWSQQAQLIGTSAISGAPQLSADGNTAIMGGNGDNNGIGGALIFTRLGSVWSQQAELVGTGAIAQSSQGKSVSLSGDGNIASVGGFLDDPLDTGQVGATWIFTRSGDVWTQQAKLVGSGAVNPANQGWSVALSDDGSTLLVGGFDDNRGVGAAWVFTQSPKFAGTPGRANCRGQSVSALAQKYGGLPAAATALGYSSVQVLQNAIAEFCAG